MVGSFSLIKKILKLVRIIFSGNSKWFKAMFSGVAAGLEHRSVLPNLDYLQTVVDVGANHGQFALAVQHCFPDVKIFSFEPLSNPAIRFRKIFQGDSKVMLHQAAIGPNTGETSIHVSMADDSSSLLPISHLQQRLFPGTGEVRTDTIQVGRLDDFIDAKNIIPPALLKIDVQGAELSTLQGCEDLLNNFDYVYAECSFVELYKGQAYADEVIVWLQARNFILKGVYNMSYDKQGCAIQGDFLFQKSND